MRELLHILGIALGATVMAVGVVLLPAGYVVLGVVLLVLGLAGIAAAAWLDSWAHRPRTPRRDPVDVAYTDAARVLNEPTVPLHVAQRPSPRPPSMRLPATPPGRPLKVSPPPRPAAAPPPPPPSGRLPFGMAVYHPHMPPEPWFPHINEERR